MPALPAALQRGATYYIAAGTYASYTFTTPTAGTNYITIRKATAAAHGTDVGWVAGYGSGQAVWSGPVSFVGSSYYIFDGGERNEGDWSDTAAYGFKIYHNGNEQLVQMRTTGTDVQSIQVKNTYVHGLSTPLPLGLSRRYLVDIFNFGVPGNFINVLVSHCFLQYGNVAVFAAGASGYGGAQGMTVEYCLIKDNQQNSYNHGSCVDMYYEPTANCTIRYNRFENCVGTAVVSFTQNGGFEIYGNVLSGCETGDASFGFGLNSANDNAIYNNTIVNARGYNAGVAFGSGPAANNHVYNNLWINCMNYPTYVALAGTHDYNAFSDGDSRGEAHGQTNVAGSIFINHSGGDFRLGAKTANGWRLPAPYNVDMLGKTRGVDGIWDRGAYEYDGSVTNPIICVTPRSLAFGPLATNTSRELILTIANEGAGTLAGSASVGAPFAIVSGGTYSLGAEQKQTLSIRYGPLSPGTNSQTVIFTGGGGASATVSGVGNQ